MISGKTGLSGAHSSVLEVEIRAMVLSHWFWESDLEINQFDHFM